MKKYNQFTMTPFSLTNNWLVQMNDIYNNLELGVYCPSSIRKIETMMYLHLRSDN